MTKPFFFYGGIPGNFHKAPIFVYSPLKCVELSFPSNEHYFQCAKTFWLPGDKDTLIMHEQIRKAATPALAKSLGQTVPLKKYDLVKDWDEFDAPVAMLTCNLAKFRQHDYCYKWLRKTGTRPLVEHSRNRIWGDGMDGSGCNLQGKILEVVRARLC